MKIALIKNNKVINIIQADTLQWAQQNYPDISNLTDQQRAIIKTLTRSFGAATEIDLADSQLQYGMQLMVDWGLITEERKNSILSVE